MQLLIDKKDFDYLRLQRGDLYSFVNDFDAFTAAYQERLSETLASMKPVLPKVCNRVLDVGSGLGGIDIFIHDHYQRENGRGPNIHLLDGESDKPKVLKHDQTFNDMFRSITFLKRNGVEFVSFSTPDNLSDIGQFDLVVSFAAWCFHFHPKIYLDYVVKHCHATTVLILDVRRNEWRDLLGTDFVVKGNIEVGKKYDRLVLGLK